MTLTELTHRLSGAELLGDPATPVTGITHDSRSVVPGQIFAALPGAVSHGVEYLQQAIDRGAAAVLSERSRPATCTLPWLKTSNPRRQTASAAWALAGDPQDHLELVGITGTNGKSTVVDLIRRILTAAGKPCAALGTLGAVLANGEHLPGVRTTPEATDLAPLLRRLVEEGTHAAALEVSSHAIALDRVFGLEFRVTVWTNLTQDHLDFHSTMEDYFATKLRLLTELVATDGFRIVPSEGPYSKRLKAVLGPADLTWGGSTGDVRASAVRNNLEGTFFTLVLPSTTLEIHLPLIGEHNLANALAAAAAAHALKIPAEAIRSGLENAEPITGRLQPVVTELPFPVYVDYAHTPAALEAVVNALSEVTDRRMIVVFGAGGDRDRDKRRPMGEAVGRQAHLSIVTSDNPRGEDPDEIAESVAEGVRSTGAVPEIIVDRREAIRHALTVADEDCLVLVAGKGHETTQTTGAEVRHFVDHEVINELATALKGGVSCP